MTTASRVPTFFGTRKLNRRGQLLLQSRLRRYWRRQLSRRRRSCRRSSGRRWHRGLIAAPHNLRVCALIRRVDVVQLLVLSGAECSHVIEIVRKSAFSWLEPLDTVLGGDWFHGVAWSVDEGTDDVNDYLALEIEVWVVCTMEVMATRVGIVVGVADVLETVLLQCE